MNVYHQSMRIILHLSLLIILIGIAAGCTLTAATPIASIPPTATTYRVIRPTPVPTMARQYQPVATEPTIEPALSADLAPKIDCQQEATVSTTRHQVNAIMDYATRSIATSQTVTHVNRYDSALTDLVLNIEPNRYPNAFTLLSLIQKDTTQGDVPPSFNLTGRRLYIELIDPVPPDCAITLDLLFTVNVPAIGSGVQAFEGFFGYSPRQVNLGHWLPSVALRQNNEWITRQAVFVGEQEVITKADWEVTLTVNNAAETLTVAAPGKVERLTPTQWRFVQPFARDFTMSISENFRVAQNITQSGTIVEVYSFDDALISTASGIVDGAEHALTTGLLSLEIFSDLFGPYPYERLLIVQGDFPDGMEFSGIVFVSTNWFRSYVGDPAHFLTLITVHEVAHQWWYARVGNDPALAPWLDEALSTYSEYVFIEEFYPELKIWWWQFRVDDYNPSGFVDSSVYEFASIREYINAVYLRGVRLLQALRDDLGTEVFFDWLKRYAETGDGQIVSAEVFWSLLTAEQLEATSATRALYLRQP